MADLREILGALLQMGGAGLGAYAGHKQNEKEEKRKEEQLALLRRQIEQQAAESEARMAAQNRQEERLGSMDLAGSMRSLLGPEQLSQVGQTASLPAPVDIPLPMGGGTMQASKGLDLVNPDVAAATQRSIREFDVDADRGAFVRESASRARELVSEEGRQDVRELGKARGLAKERTKGTFEAQYNIDLETPEGQQFFQHVVDLQVEGMELDNEARRAQIASARSSAALAAAQLREMNENDRLTVEKRAADRIETIAEGFASEEGVPINASHFARATSLLSQSAPTREEAGAYLFIGQQMASSATASDREGAPGTSGSGDGRVLNPAVAEPLKYLGGELLNRSKIPQIRGGLSGAFDTLFPRQSDLDRERFGGQNISSPSRVVDGDTVVHPDSTRIRYPGIDAAESGSPLGDSLTNANQRLTGPDRGPFSVNVGDEQGRTRDVYGRLLADLVAQGYSVQDSIQILQQMFQEQGVQGTFRN